MSISVGFAGSGGDAAAGSAAHKSREIVASTVEGETRMTRPNDPCSSTTCSLAPLRIGHYRWQCGSDTFDRPAFRRCAVPGCPRPAHQQVMTVAGLMLCIHGRLMWESCSECNELAGYPADYTPAGHSRDMT